MQSFNILDDVELEFLVEIRDQDEGALKVMKTRDMVIVESIMVFKIDSNVICDEMYIFPEDQLLIKSKLGYLKPIKDIFRQNAKMETLSINFTPHKMSFSGL